MMTELYGNAWESFPIKAGETWQVGPHLVSVQDLEYGGVEWWARHSYAIMYCDPPWDEAKVKHFRAAAGDTKPGSYEGIVVALGSIAAHATDAVFVEGGMKKLEAWDAEARSRGIPHLTTHTPVYGGSIPFQLWQGGSYPRVTLPFVEGGKGEKAMAILLAPWHGTGAVIGDPCTGLGMTARVASKLGLTFIGTELHPRRAARTIQWLNQHRGAAPPAARVE